MPLPEQPSLTGRTRRTAMSAGGVVPTIVSGGGAVVSRPPRVDVVSVRRMFYCSRDRAMIAAAPPSRRCIAAIAVAAVIVLRCLLTAA